MPAITLNREKHDGSYTNLVLYDGEFYVIQYNTMGREISRTHLGPERSLGTIIDGFERMRASL